ncbi:n amino acid transport system protein [Teratosphaeria destructans]|uniref:N amino acid transport system protein n=1 Tax=Teratosphaeria destructans TaxID=418781 RepID=A0A9W7SJJ8_9PEZI|nr:n amino acid transport system protein [Teratosphaeria destructans]
MVIYYWCGTWIASPSFASAGPLLKKVAYGIAFPSLIVSAGIFNNNIAAKYTFVRLLRNTRHLQSNSWQHWATWLGCHMFFGIAAFIITEAIPVFNYVLSRAGSLCFAPMSLIVPASLYMWEFAEDRKGSIGQETLYGLHVLIAAVGLFLVVGGWSVVDGAGIFRPSLALL